MKSERPETRVLPPPCNYYLTLTSLNLFIQIKIRSTNHIYPMGYSVRLYLPMDLLKVCCIIKAMVILKDCG